MEFHTTKILQLKQGTFSESIQFLSLADLGGAPPARPPYGPKCSQFHAVFRKMWQNHMLVRPPPGGLAPPPTGNPGSAPACLQCITLNTF